MMKISNYLRMLAAGIREFHCRRMTCTYNMLAAGIRAYHCHIMSMLKLLAARIREYHCHWRRSGHTEEEVRRRGEELVGVEKVAAGIRGYHCHMYTSKMAAGIRKSHCHKKCLTKLMQELVVVARRHSMKTARP